MGIAELITMIVGLVATVAGTATDIGVGLKQGAKNYANMWKSSQYQALMDWYTFRREDTSIRRRVNDLKRAGLSPVLAAGQGAQSSHVASIMAPQQHLPTDTGGKVAGLLDVAIKAAVAKATIDKTDAEKQRIQFETDVKKAMFPLERMSAQKDLLMKGLDFERLLEKLDQFKEHGQDETGVVGATIKALSNFLRAKEVHTGDYYKDKKEYEKEIKKLKEELRRK